MTARPGADGTVRVAVIGAGQWGPNLIRNFRDADGSDVAWIVDQRAERLERVASRYPDASVSTRPEDAIDDPAVDAVVVATPSATHHALASRALEAGKHVLVEKPMTTDAASSRALCELAERRGLVLMVGHVFLYNVAVEHVRRTIRAGELGRIYYVSMVRTNLGPVRVDVNAAWDLAAHDVSIVSHWLDAEPTSVSARAGSWLNAGVEDAVFATLRYPGDVLVNLHASWLNPRKAREITVVGERKMLTFDDMSLSEPIRVYDKRVEGPAEDVVDSFVSFRASVSEGAITIPRVPLGEPLRAECDHFLECIRSGATPVSDGRNGLAIVRVLEAIDRSVRAGGAEEAVAP